MNDIINEMIEIEPVDSDSFLQIAETLTRIGLIKRQNNKATLYQTACLLHKQGHYYIAHFKQMYRFDGRTENTMSDEDTQRLFNIVNLLSSWNMIKPLKGTPAYDAAIKTVVVKHSEKNKFEFVKPYNIGGKPT